MLMQMRVNQLAFNPLQPTVLLLASEDHNLYTFDIRHLTDATQVYKSHVGAVMTCDWSPTGRDFVSGSYDRTVRLWQIGKGRSRDSYHTKRMQRVFSSIFTLDSRFVLCGSDDGNLRIWKAKASEKLGPIAPRERAQREYRDALRSKWSSVGEVSRIERQRFLPKSIYNAQKLMHDVLEAERRKDANRRRHAPNNLPSRLPEAERRRAILYIDQ